MQFGKKNEKSTQYGVKYFFNAFRSNTTVQITIISNGYVYFDIV